MQLTDYYGEILGICTGYQILAKMYSNTLERIKKIGVYNVKFTKENPLIKKEKCETISYTHSWLCRMMKSAFLR